MAPVGDDRLFDGLDPQCPSELVLDRLVAEELGTTEAREASRHVQSCERCRARMALREDGFASLPPFDTSRAADVVFAAQSEAKATSWWSNLALQLRRPFVFMPLAAAPIAALLLVVLIRPPDRIVAKGSVKLRAFKARGASSQEVSSSDRLTAGDRLRFKVEAPDGDNIMIVSVEDSGKKSAIFPKIGASHSGPAVFDKDGVLVGAIQLDDYPGEEWIHLVWCPRAFSLSDVNLAQPASPQIPKACQTDSFRVRR